MSVNVQKDRILTAEQVDLVLDDLVAVGIVQQTEDDRFLLTPLGCALMQQDERSIKGWCAACDVRFRGGDSLTAHIQFAHPNLFTFVSAA